MKNQKQQTSEIEYQIHIIRGKRVMLDRDLSSLYGVTTGALNQAVKRNSERFPEDFMFQLSAQEMRIWISQFVISKSTQKGIRQPPYAFTEQGVAMLSSVLKSKQAIQVNIQIMRTFTKIREMLVSNKELREKIEGIEKKYDEQFNVVFAAIKQILDPPEDPKPKIGFRTD